MRLHRDRFARGLSFAALVAALALFATEQTSAQSKNRGGFNQSKGSFTTQRYVQPRSTTAPSGKKMSSTKPKKGKAGIPTLPPGAAGAAKPPSTGPVVGDKNPPGSGPTRPPRPDRPRPDRPPRPGYPGWIGPAIGTGVLIGPGVVIANPPPPPPPSFGGPSRPQGPSGPGASASINIPPANEQRFVPNEVVLEFAGSFSPQAMTDLARRHRLARLDSVSLQSTNSTYFRARIVDGRPVRTVLAGLRNEVSLRSGQPNYLFSAAQQTSDAPATFTPPAAALPAATPVAAAAGALPAMGDPAQYSLAKLRLQEAHGLTKGNNVLVAVIDSGVDAGHPELRGVIAGTFDALNKSEKPHLHGTAMAGAIAARSRLMGVAPAARILAIRAFSASGDSAQATTFAILKGIDHAVNKNARVINMSFAGPADPGVARALATARAKGIVLVAAAGNLGEKSPPQYPAADPNVIAVTATDAEDKLFQASNRGGHIAVAAPGVDILVPAPGANYDMTSGTSVASAHVSGVVALILERKPGLDPDAVREILLSTARDLGPSGQDEQFGAGLADAYQAILALEPRTAGSETVAGPGR
jgi:hypothetical protein